MSRTGRAQRSGSGATAALSGDRVTCGLGRPRQLDLAGRGCRRVCAARSGLLYCGQHPQRGARRCLSTYGIPIGRSDQSGQILRVGGRIYSVAVHLERKRFTAAGVEVRAGARDRRHSNLEKLAFTFWAVCDSAEPESWHGEVRFGSTVLLTTEAAADEAMAGRLAERALEAKVVALFGQSAG